MTQVDLRPLTMGEILDRTFSLYRRHFLLFIGITAIPELFLLALQILQVRSSSAQTLYSIIATILVTPLLVVATLVVYLTTQGATIVAVTELYLGRTATIASSLRQVLSRLGSLLGVVILNALALIGATVLLIIPGIYVACRLLVCVPVAVIEGRGPRQSLSRSFDLTKENALRAFVILLIFGVTDVAIVAVIQAPILFELQRASDPGTQAMWTIWEQVAQTFTTILVQPILLIGSSLFYFDLRVRKEGFDLQFLLDPASGRGGPDSGVQPIA